MACRFFTGIPAGAGTGAAVLGIRNTRPVSGGYVVIDIFRSIVRTSRTGNCSLMLSGRIAGPRAIGQTVTGVFGGTVGTSGTGNGALMLLS